MGAIIIGIGIFIIGVCCGLFYGWIQGYGEGLKESENHKLK